MIKSEKNTTAKKELSASFEAFEINEQLDFETWQQVIESEVTARRLLEQALEYASEADASLLSKEIQQRKFFLLELLCKDGQLLDR